MPGDSEARSSRIIKNVLMNWTAFAATVLAGFLMSPFLVRHLGDSIYGVWILIGSLVGYLGLLDFGITPSILKYIAEYRARGDQAAINRVVSGAFAVFSLLGLLSLLASLAIAFSFNDIFNTPLGDNTAAAVVILAGINLAVTFPALVFIGVLRGYQRYDIDASITALTIIARSLLVVVLIRRGYGIMALALSTFAFDMLRLAYLIRSAYRLNPSIRISRAYVERAEMRRLFGYSAYVFVMIVGKQMIFYTDSIIIGLFLTTSSVTAYFVASRLVIYLQMLVSEMVGVLTPTTSDLDARDDHKGIKELLVLSTKYMLMIALPASAIFFVMGGDFIALWMGPSFAGSARILPILTVATLAHLIEMPADTVLLGLGKHRVVAGFLFLQAVANLILSVALVEAFGMEGVAFATAIPMICFTSIAMVVYFKNHLRIPLSEYLRRSMPLPILVQVPFVALLLLLKRYRPPSSLLGFFVEVALALIPYAILCFAVCMSHTERQAFFRMAEKFRLKLSPLSS
jgi:O-antigen/teichoic acid export membrane protein